MRYINCCRTVASNQEKDMLSDKLIRGTLSSNLRRLRQAKGWSQDRLAKEAGLTTVGYGSIERGETIPRISTLAKIAAALGCRLDELLPISSLV